MHVKMAGAFAVFVACSASGGATHGGPVTAQDAGGSDADAPDAGPADAQVDGPRSLALDGGLDSEAGSPTDAGDSGSNRLDAQAPPMIGPGMPVTGSATFYNSRVSVSLDPNTYASAIVSVQYKGVDGWKEFILNSGAGAHATTQRGASLQSVAFFDYPNNGYSSPTYVCRNPIEAGSHYDAAETNIDTGATGVFGVTSPSRINSPGVSSFSSSTQMAFWVDPARCYDLLNQFGEGGPFKIENKALSGVYLTKAVTVGSGGIDNIVEMDITFSTPVAHSFTQVDVLTGYHPRSEFYTFLTYDPRNQALTVPSATFWNNPTIVRRGATDDYAFAVYLPANALEGQPGAASSGYSRDGFPAAYNITGWEAFQRFDVLPAGHHAFKAYIVVGNMTEVRSSLDLLYRRHHP
jgi:hypothetical protein